MCGFVVTSDIISIEPMIEAQKMRGPDDTGIWKDSRIAMGHVLLDINGEHQVQPFVTKKGNIMVFNGEMYDSNIANDTAFLAHGFETYGHKFVEFSDFHGSFVFYKPKGRFEAQVQNVRLPGVCIQFVLQRFVLLFPNSFATYILHQALKIMPIK